MSDGESVLPEACEFAGDSPGPRLLVTAGVHGDEYLPMLAVRELVGRFRDDPGFRGDLRGTLTLIPVVNLPAFERGHRCGPDGKDLARTCPGSEDGTATERIAAALSRRIESADFYVDLHTGGTELCVLPLAGYVLHPDKDILDKQRDLARAFGLPFCWGTAANLPGRSLSVARDANVPAIYVEYLGGHRELAECNAGAVASSDPDHPLVAGCLGVMRHLGMIDGPEPDTTDQEFVEDWRPDSGHMQVCHPAPATGFLEPLVELGATVSAGDPLARVTSEDGDEEQLVFSEQAGKVVVQRDYPRINRGDAVAVVAEPFPPT